MLLSSPFWLRLGRSLFPTDDDKTEDTVIMKTSNLNMLLRVFNCVLKEKWNSSVSYLYIAILTSSFMYSKTPMVLTPMARLPWFTL